VRWLTQLLADTEAMQWRMHKPLAMEDGFVELPFRTVSCSVVRVLVRRMYSVVLDEIPDSGYTGMREDLSGVRRIKKNLNPPVDR